MNADDPAVAVLPNNRKLGVWSSNILLDTLNWPLGQPARLRGKRLRHLRPTDHLLLYPRTTSYFRPTFGTRAKISIMVVEPEVVHQRHLKKLEKFYWRFHRVLTAKEPLAKTLPNGVFFPFGSTWVPEWHDVDVTKTNMISLIATAKRSQPGHHPRHEIIDWARTENQNLEAIGRGYKPFDKKADGHARYQGKSSLLGRYGGTRSARGPVVFD